MKIILTSDTHYGFNDKTYGILEKFLQETAQVIDKENVRILVHAGDWISHKQEQFPKVLELFRKYINIPILTVRGNHDFWEKTVMKRQLLAEYDKRHDELFEKFGIIRLHSKNQLIKEGIAFIGFDGWYKDPQPPTNDINWIPTTYSLDVDGLRPFHKQAYNEFDELLRRLENHEFDGKTKVFITHFPNFSDSPTDGLYNADRRQFDYVSPYLNFLLCGHSHKTEDMWKNSVRVYNAGSDYNQPKYKLIDLDLWKTPNN